MAVLRAILLKLAHQRTGSAIRIAALLILVFGGNTLGSKLLIAQTLNAENADSVETQAEKVRFTAYLYQVGDDQRWAKQDWPDADWLPLYHHGLPDTPQVYWTRNHLTVSGHSTIRPMTVTTSILGAHEVYFDGQLLGRSGQVGEDADAEAPGPISNEFPIPESLYNNGDHVLSLRVSSFHSPDNLRVRYYEVKVVANDVLKTTRYRNTLLPLMLLGCFLMIAIYYQFMYWIYRQNKTMLIFSFLCFSAAALLLNANWVDLVGYNYDWHWFSLVATVVLTGLLSVLLILFLLHQFDLEHKLVWFGVSSIAVGGPALLASNLMNANFQLFIAAIVVSLVITGSALKKNTEGSAFTFVGLALVTIFGLINPVEFMAQYLFPSFAVLILFMLASLAIRTKIQQEHYQANLLTSARLETELVKMNIQPHFVLNTLASMGELMEQKPELAGEFIEALADEFRLLNGMTSKKLVPLQEELDLCSCHLKIMSLRNDIEYSLNTAIGNINCEIPPAIFHTLLENAISHNTSLVSDFNMHLQQTTEEHSVVYQFRSPYHQSQQRTAIGVGAGLKYVKARLQESFPNAWSLSEKQIEDSWVTEITIVQKAKKQGLQVAR